MWYTVSWCRRCRIHLYVAAPSAQGDLPPTSHKTCMWLYTILKKLTTQMYRQMLIIRIMEYPQPGQMVPNQKGGQNLVDQNNYVYQKACFSPDQSKQLFKCVLLWDTLTNCFFCLANVFYLSWCIFMLSCCDYCKKITFPMFLCSEIYK